MKRLLANRLALLAVLATLLAGGTVGAIAATSESPGRHARAGAIISTPARARARNVDASHRGFSRVHARRSAARALNAAATYLGLSFTQLRSELRAGKSLAQLAHETPGRNELGLIAAIEAAQRGKLVGKIAKRLSRRVTAEVHSPGGPGRLRGERGLRQQARAYLGLSKPGLLSDTRAGKSLAQIARSTPGRSEAGLVQALVAARRAELAQAVKAGLVTAGQEAARLAGLQQRMTAFAHRVPRLRTAKRPNTTSAS